MIREELFKKLISQQEGVDMIEKVVEPKLGNPDLFQPFRESLLCRGDGAGICQCRDGWPENLVSRRPSVC